MIACPEIAVPRRHAGAQVIAVETAGYAHDFEHWVEGGAPPDWRLVVPVCYSTTYGGTVARLLFADPVGADE